MPYGTWVGTYSGLGQTRQTVDAGGRSLKGSRKTKAIYWMFGLEGVGVGVGVDLNLDEG